MTKDGQFMQSRAGSGDSDSWTREFALAAINSLPGIFYLIDRSGQFRYWNSNFETLTGYSAAEIGQIHALDLFDLDTRPLVKQALKQAFEQGKASIEAPMLTRHGPTPPYNCFGRVVQIAGESFVAGMGLDISRLKQAQRAQAEQAQQLRHLAGHVPGVIYQLKRSSEGALSMPFASAKIFEVFGVRHEEVAADAAPLFARIYSEDAERVLKAVDISARSDCFPAAVSAVPTRRRECRACRLDRSGIKSGATR